MLAHCGWRSLALGLAGRAAATLIAHGAEPETLQAWIGPCIRPSQYEVGEELVQCFVGKWPDAQCSPDGVSLDLAAVAHAQLRFEGIDPANIADSGVCTFADATRFHSYRRDGDASGRLFSFIGWQPV